jgi:hypothetical protein
LRGGGSGSATWAMMKQKIEMLTVCVRMGHTNVKVHTAFKQQSYSGQASKCDFNQLGLLFGYSLQTARE